MPLDISTGAGILSLHRSQLFAASRLRDTGWRSLICRLKDERHGPVVAVDDNYDVGSLRAEVELSFCQELSN